MLEHNLPVSPFLRHSVICLLNDQSLILCSSDAAASALASSVCSECVRFSDGVKIHDRQEGYTPIRSLLPSVFIMSPGNSDSSVPCVYAHSSSEDISCTFKSDTAEPLSVHPCLSSVHIGCHPVGSTYLSCQGAENICFSYSVFSSAQCRRPSVCRVFSSESLTSNLKPRE